MFQLSRFNLNVGFWNFWWPLMLQGAALGFIFVPLTTITNNAIPNERIGNATSLFNLMRNIGASIGISMVETVQFRTQQTHINRLSAHVNPESLTAQQMFQGLKSYFISQGSSDSTASHQAYLAMWGTVQQQAAMLSYNDTFLFLGFVFVAMFPFLLLFESPSRASPRP